MSLSDFITSLEMELRLRGEPFDRRDLETFASDVWPLAEEDPEPGRWTAEFLEAQQPA
jgi:hypothetical protein